MIYRALTQARQLWDEGERDAAVLRAAAHALLKAEPLLEEIDYVSVADAHTLEELGRIEGPAMVSTAARLGATRLIDNVLLG